MFLRAGKRALKLLCGLIAIETQSQHTVGPSGKHLAYHSYMSSQDGGRFTNILVGEPKRRPCPPAYTSPRALAVSWAAFGPL